LSLSNGPSWSDDLPDFIFVTSVRHAMLEFNHRREMARARTLYDHRGSPPMCDSVLLSGLAGQCGEEADQETAAKPANDRQYHQSNAARHAPSDINI
jgi:hypothetical protein